MNRIDRKFQQLKRDGRKALIPYITAGDPDIDTTVRLIKTLGENGADVIEIGVPYSDPVADGPVIQKANARALSRGLRIRDIMSCVTRARETVSQPMLYLLYLNCVLQYGKERFFSDCAACGIDGVIIPDLPFEESDEVIEYADRYGIHVISLVAPTSTERLEKVLKNAKGFVYCVSSLGVTGIRSGFKDELGDFMEKVSGLTDTPRAIGFGISTPEQAAGLKKYCEGIIVGSAVVKRIEEGTALGDTEERVGTFVTELRKALD